VCLFPLHIEQTSFLLGLKLSHYFGFSDDDDKVSFPPLDAMGKLCSRIVSRGESESIHKSKYEAVKSLKLVINRLVTQIAAEKLPFLLGMG
jgi:hypothetical protein